MGTFGTSINCIDGRVQLPITDWIKKNYSVDFIDMISEPGSDKAMLDDPDMITRLKSKILISVNGHKSKSIILSGHHDCLGNPVTKEEHIDHIKKSVDIIKTWNLPASVNGIWVNENWSIEKIC